MFLCNKTQKSKQHFKGEIEEKVRTHKCDP